MADKTLTDLTATTALVDADTLYVNDGGNSRKITFANTQNSVREATTSVKGFLSGADKTKLDGVEALADVTDATNVAAAGALMTVGGTMTGALTLGAGASVDGGGKQIAHHILSVVTSVTGNLSITAHSGNVIKTSGNITVPTTAGFHCTVIGGGAHTISFNATTSAAMASGDIVSLFVESSTIIHAIKVVAADKLAFA